MSSSRRHKYEPNCFCYCCGKWIEPCNENKRKRGKTTRTRVMNHEFIEAFNAYFANVKCQVGDLDKEWAPDRVCDYCYSILIRWWKGERCCLKYSAPAQWRESTSCNTESGDCFFCRTQRFGPKWVYGWNEKTTAPEPRPANEAPPDPPFYFDFASSSESDSDSDDPDYVQEHDNGLASGRGMQLDQAMFDTIVITMLMGINDSRLFGSLARNMGWVLPETRIDCSKRYEKYAQYYTFGEAKVDIEVEVEDDEIDPDATEIDTDVEYEEPKPKKNQRNTRQNQSKPNQAISKKVNHPEPKKNQQSSRKNQTKRNQSDVNQSNQSKPIKAQRNTRQSQSKQKNCNVDQTNQQKVKKYQRKSTENKSKSKPTQQKSKKTNQSTAEKLPTKPKQNQPNQASSKNKKKEKKPTKLVEKTFKVVYCNDIEKLFAEFGTEYKPDDWRLWMDSSASGFKAALLHNEEDIAKRLPAVMIAYSTDMPENYYAIEQIFKLFDYKKENHNWKICADLKMIAIVCGIKKCYCKHQCYLCNFEGRADEFHFVEHTWVRWTTENTVIGQRSIYLDPLVTPDKIILPDLHIKLGMMKQFVKAMDQSTEAFKYLRQKFPRLSKEKIKEGVFIGPQITKLFNDDVFIQKLRAKNGACTQIEPEQAAEIDDRHPTVVFAPTRWRCGKTYAKT